MEEPRKPDMTTTKRILRYIKGAMSYKIVFSRNQNSSEVQVLGFIDSDWSGDAEDRKKILQGIFS